MNSVGDITKAMGTSEVRELCNSSLVEFSNQFGHCFSNLKFCILVCLPFIFIILSKIKKN